MKFSPIEQLNESFVQGETRKLGRLAWYNRQILFEYDPAFLASGIEISPIKLPLKAGVFVPEDKVFDGLFGVFNDSLPDGWGRLLLDRQVEKYGINRRQLTPLDRLAFIGHQGMGSLVYHPELGENSDNGSLELLSLDVLAIETQRILSGETEQIFPQLLALNGGSAGARPKIVAQVSQDKTQIIHGASKLEPGYEHWLIKFSSSYDSTEMASIEYAYHLMAKEAGIELPQTHLFITPGGKYFGTQRFDRRGNERVHMHSLCGLIHADFRTPSLDYDLFLKIVWLLTKNSVDVEKAFSLACFNVLSHNRDDHSKNFSFILDDNFKWKLAPAYDLTFSYGPNGEHSTTVMGEGRAPSIEHLRSLGKKHGLKKAEKLLEQVQAAIGKWADYAEISGLTERTMKDIGVRLNQLR